MEDCKEIVEKLSREGINWYMEPDGRLTYTGNYEHASAVVDVREKFFTICNECCDPGESGVICERRFANQFDGREPGMEEVLRDVSEAVGRIDQGIEDALNAVCGYDLREY
jgi:hypothetical protein